MKRIVFFILSVSVFSLQLRAQYFMRGTVYDESGKGLNHVKIILSSRNVTPFYTGVSGAYVIPLRVAVDTITIASEGYQVIKTVTYASRFEVFRLKPAVSAASFQPSKLLSVISLTPDDIADYYAAGESYRSLAEHNFTHTAQFPVSGLSLRTDRASYSNIRRFINIGMPVPPDAVRIDEMLNYFDLSTGTPPEEGFGFSSVVTDAPWDPQHRLLLVNILAPRMRTDTLPAANLVFVIDISGSMDQPSRLPLLKNAFKMLVRNLRQQDRIAIVTYGGGVNLYLSPISCLYKDSINNMIERLEASGETPGGAAIKTAYRVAEQMYSPAANNRIIIATDGDFNVGPTSDEAMQDLVLRYRQSGIYLTCLGVGAGNYKDSKLETLAEKGNGNFAYLDNLQEAEKVLIKEFTKTIYPVADDACVTISFDPQRVSRYRLIGYDFDRDLIEDTSGTLEGGEVGFGHSFMLAYEIEPAVPDSAVSGTGRTPPLGQLCLHYRLPGSDSGLIARYAPEDHFTPFYTLPATYRFATAIMMFGGLLKQSPLWLHYSWDEVAAIASDSARKDDYAQQEFIQLVEKAKDIYTPESRKKRNKKSDTVVLRP